MARFIPSNRATACRYAPAGGLIGLLALTLLAALPVPARAQIFDPTTYTLDNGLQIVVIENHRAPVATHMVWYKVGAADEPPGKSGIAHFLEHLMFKGTPEHPAGAFSEIVARNGGRENAFTSQDYTGYFQTVAADRLALMMELEADRMTNLVLTDAVIEPERKVVLEERRSRVDNNPAAILSEQVGAVTWLNHPYRLPVIGWAHEIATLTRAEIVDFYRHWYAPNNAILVVAGDITAAELRPLAEKYYGAIPRGPELSRRRPQEPPHHAARQVELRDARVKQSGWSRVFLAPSHFFGATQHVYPLEVLADILGGGATSRLYRDLVVEKKLAVSAGAFYSSRGLGPARFGVYASPRSGVGMDQIEAAVEDVLEEIRKSGVTDDEVTRAKGRIQAQAIFARDSLRAGAQALGSALASGLSIEDVESWPERIEAVSRPAVEAAFAAVTVEGASVTARLLPAGGEI